MVAERAAEACARAGDREAGAERVLGDHFGNLGEGAFAVADGGRGGLAGGDACVAGKHSFAGIWGEDCRQGERKGADDEDRGRAPGSRAGRRSPTAPRTPGRRSPPRAPRPLLARSRSRATRPGQNAGPTSVRRARPTPAAPRARAGRAPPRSRRSPRPSRAPAGAPLFAGRGHCRPGPDTVPVPLIRSRVAGPPAGSWLGVSCVWRC